MSYEVKGARVVAQNLASTTSEFLMRLQELGATIGTDGTAVLPELKPVIEGLFQVLAGGEVEVKVVHRGNPDIVRELEKRLADSTAEANQINKDLSFYLTATI
jgi:hypothetical protein